MAKLLLVEDDNNLREIYEARLQAEGYVIVTAKDGEEALAVAKAETPDLIISDIMMPKISGFEMLDILRNTEGLKNSKVIMLTALGQDDDQQRADKLGADRYMVKSQVTLEDIVKAAHDLLEDQTASGTPDVKVAASPAPAPVVTTPMPKPTPPPPTSSVMGLPAAPNPPVNSTGPSAPPPASIDLDSVSGFSGDELDQPSGAPRPRVSEVPGARVNPHITSIPVAVKADEVVSTEAAQTTKQEEAAVEDKIEDFVAGASSEATPPAAVEPPAATPPATPVVAAAPAPPPVAPPIIPAPVDTATQAANVASDDKLMTTAVTNLMTPEPTTTAAAPTPVVPPPAPVASTTPAVTTTSNPGSVPIAHKKVISPPVETPKTDIQTLYELEEAKNAAAAGKSSATAVVSTDAGTQTAPINTNPSIPAPVVPPPTDNPTDPNSIAL